MNALNLETTPPPSSFVRVVRWLDDNRWLVLLVLAGLVVRLHWNLEVHPPADYIYSDMNGYVRRADVMFADLWRPREYHAFFPYGTHVLLYAVQRLAGRTAQTPPDELGAGFRWAALAYAAMGAAVVGYGYALARRVTRFPVVAPAMGLLLVCYYPLISLGGYFLSETPFALCLTAATFYLVRMVDTGSKRDAWATGVFVAAGATFRPQILMSVAFIGVFWLIRRRHMPMARFALWARALVPIVAMLGFSAWRVHHHTGRVGLISENGTFNRVFGRCHNTNISAYRDETRTGRTSFGPPPMLQLGNRAHRARGRWPQLEPADAKHLEFVGYIGDKEALQGFIDRCVETTGWVKQLEYSLVNVTLYWRFNTMWPDSGTGAWRHLARAWGLFVANVLATPALLALGSVLMPRRFLKLGLVSLHLWALTMVGALYMGGMRFRAPYDPVIILMAFEANAVFGAFVWSHACRLRDRMRPTPSQ